MVSLAVLDQSPVPQGSSPAQALAATVALARAAEALGYRRFWLAEHHNTASLAGSAPEIGIAAVAARTSSIRVGAGGVLLSHYSPLKVAEVFRTLEALFPGRIDLGLGRAAGTDDRAVRALRQFSGAGGDERYPEQVGDLLDFLHDRLADEHPFAGVHAMPTGPGAPQVWVLSSSSYGADLAAAYGLRLSYAQFVSPLHGAQVLAAYRRRFRPSGENPEPVANLAVSALCAGSDAEAERLVASHDLWSLRPEGAGSSPLLPPDEAAARPLTDLERVLVAQHRRRRVVGAPGRVRDALLALAAEHGVDELVVRTICHDPGARLRSYELLAEAFELRPPPPPPFSVQ
jgi:luciferase family oxidoreductase group 1